MTGRSPGELAEIEGLLRELEEVKQALLEAVAQLTDAEFAWQPPQGDPLKRLLEKAADDVNFHYGWLVTRVRGLPPIPCLQPADFLSVREASITLQVVHRRFTNQLHDLRAEELARTVGDEGKEPQTLREVLQRAAEHYRQTAVAVESSRNAFRQAQP